MATATGVRRRPGRPARLSREQVLRAAVAIADADGLDGVTMQNVARALGAESMSLYRHVANKDDLLDGMVDLVYGEVTVPSPDAPWAEATRRRAASVREALLRHPWAVMLMESRAHPGPATLAHHDAVLANLLGAGFSAATATRVYNLVDSYVYGFAIQETTLPIETSEALGELDPAIQAEYASGRYPHLERVAAELIGSGFRYADEFAHGLELVVGALEREFAGVAARRGA